jgi:hypothetical protein
VIARTPQVRPGNPLAISTLMLSSSADLAVEVRSQSAGAEQACNEWTLTRSLFVSENFAVPVPQIPCSIIGEFIVKGRKNQDS